MKFIIIFLLVTASVLLAQDSTAVENHKGTLTVLLTDLPNDDGVVMVALSNSKEDYEEKGKAFMGLSAKVTQKKSEVLFSNVPFGEYAVKVYHDEDEDGELNTNFLGIPSEAYGFSNNAEGSFGPAAWEDAKFTFSSQTDTLSIRVD